MVSTLGTRPSHYEMLGLEPTASAEEIREAFARQMRAPRRMADIARIGIAYSTLRDATKRREYDRSIGLGATPEPPQPGIPVTYRPWSAFIASPATFPVKGGGASARPPEAPPEPPSEPHVIAQPKREGPGEPKFASPIGEALRELAKPEPLRRPETEEAARSEPGMPDILALEERARGPEERIIDWKYPLIAVGGVLLTAAVLGGWAGMAAGSDAEAAQERGVTVALPKARPHPTVAAEAPAAEAQPEWLDRAGVSGARRVASRQKPRAWAEREVAESSGAQDATEDAARDPLAPEPGTTPVAAEAVAASMPLPGKLVARTIERIGYDCGEVASTAAVDGAPGTYRVTCSSGQTYQATPVHGRYRFRRSGH